MGVRQVAGDKQRSQVYDVVIIGGGFWGTVLSRVLSIGTDAQGSMGLSFSCLLIDDENPRGASRNAAGIVCLDWYKHKTIKKMTPSGWDLFGKRDEAHTLDNAVRFMMGMCGLRKTGEMFSSYSNHVPKFREDCYTIEKARRVLDKWCGSRTTAKVERIQVRKDCTVTHTNFGRYYSNQVVVCAGAFTDEVLLQSQLPTVGVSGLRGRALLGKVSLPQYPEIPQTYLSRPYTFYTVRPWGKIEDRTVFVGNTTEKTDTRGDAPVDELRATAKKVCPSFVETEVLDGIRPVCAEFTVKRVHPRVIAATGGHRVGLALAPIVAWKIRDLLLERD
jgi:glycine/D-amino acid oxidase-like deaminating enzyme